MHRCDLDFFFRDLTVFCKCVQCSGWPYFHDGVIRVSVRQQEGARIVESTEDCTWLTKAKGTKKLQGTPHIRCHLMHFGEVR